MAQAIANVANDYVDLTQLPTMLQQVKSSGECVQLGIDNILQCRV